MARPKAKAISPRPRPLTVTLTVRLDEVVMKDCPEGQARPHLVWDLTNNMSYAQWKAAGYAGTLPCLLRGHRLWSVAARRPILGLELLRGQGFVGDVRVEGEVHGKHFCVPATRWGVDLDCVLLI